MADDGFTRQIISRNEAIALGLKKFFTGQPCKRGHIAERLACPGMDCIQCRDERAKEWAKRNPDRRHAIRTKWRKANPEKAYQSNVRYCNKHRAKINALSKAAYAADPQKHLKYTKDWADAHPLELQVHRYNNRARRNGWTGQMLTHEYYRNMLDQQQGKCAYCNEAKKLTFEHVQALAREGTHDPGNCVLACFPCNIEKGLDPLAVFLERHARKNPHRRISTVDDVKRLLEAPWRQFVLD